MNVTLQPQNVFDFFIELTKIPHTSGHEQAISDYLMDFAQKRGLKAHQDAANNVIIWKEGTMGYEQKEPVIIQGHMDMVGEKTKESPHNFLTDPLALRVVDGYLCATDTTLGGDNGIAVAMGLALLDASDLAHPPIELLITTEEETGMGGAQALDPSLLKGTRLLNIDSEEEGIFFVSCAGGNVTKVTFKPTYERFEQKGYEITLSGLRGGHSGLEIIQQRGNAIKLLARALNQVPGLRLSLIEGGAKHNAIAREARAIFSAPSLDEKALKAFCETVLAKEYPQDAIACHLRPVTAQEWMDEATSRALLDYLYVVPDGVQSMMNGMDHMVESSLNVGVLEHLDGTLVATHAIRSASPSRKEELRQKVTILAQHFMGEAKTFSDYPEWAYDPESELTKRCLQTYEETTGKKGRIMGIHAGLECGLLKKKRPKADMISFGPDMTDVHTPKERLSIASVERTWTFLKALLKNL
ncbi:Aminoacyl-histidine dipeptidase (Peptidase D) [Clostridiaceae bacterium JG1575]|nr:Aminoacyl-histidine dipeptidase (Peptidase D) [Clostridiaceae bacterium JG1575]